MRIYLDNGATTELSNSMKQYIISTLDLYGNPSSLHSVGEPVKQLISKARQSVANFINTSTNNIYFTSGGSASNTLAIRGYYEKHNCTILYSPIAHKSILKCVENCKNAYPIKVDNNGFIDFEDLKAWFDTHNINPFVIIDYANSEIGTVQNIKKLIDLIHFYNGIVYLDCTGSIPTIPIDVKKLNVDMLGFSAHKLGGLKGCGILYKKKDIDLEPLIYGSQEQGYVGGTENVLGIASLGKAVEDYDYSSISSVNRNYVYDYIINNIPNSYLVGASIESGNRLPYNLYMCFKGIEGESLMILLDMNGIQVSTGSACNSQSISASTILSAIGMNEEDIHSCIRLSFSGKETKKELDYVCNKLKECVESLRRLNAKENGNFISSDNRTKGTNKMKINIHAGHNPDGKIACGAVGLIKESTEARIVKDKVIAMLKSQGHTVYDCTIDNGTSQNDVLNKIVSKCNVHNVDLDISIHFNSGANDKNGNGITTGTEAFVYSSTSKAKKYAQNIVNAISALGFKNRGVKYSTSLYVLKKIKSPALLIECCFVDDKDDAKMYNADKMAQAIVKGITGISPSVQSNISSSHTTSNQTSNSNTYQVKLLEDLNIRKTPNGSIVQVNGAKKGVVYTIVETQGYWGKLKSGAGWISVSDKHVKRYSQL